MMMSAMPKIKVLVSDETGATSIEYAFIAGGIALAIATAVTLLGGGLAPIYQRMADLF